MDKPIATAPEIMSYLDEVVTEHDIERHIRYNHWVTDASWSTADACWTVRANTGEGEATLTANFLFMCQGYYNYQEGYRPEFPNEDAFNGTIVHPQQWPDDLDYKGKRMVVIGSGADGRDHRPRGRRRRRGRSPSCSARPPTTSRWTTASRTT